MSNKRLAGYMLVTDMDGTLLNSSKQISDENRSAIERFVAQGGLFTLATGRIASSVKRFADTLPLGAPAIIYNGAIIHDFTTGKPVWQRTLNKAEVKSALKRVMERFPELGVEVYSGEEPYFLRENSMTDHHRRMEHFTRPLTQNIEELTEPWFKVLTAWEPARLDEVQAYVFEHESQLTWVRSDDKYLEILPDGATKGHALEHLMELVGIEKSKCIAMGDHLNDLEMIKRAGIGIAVANAHETLLEASNRTCCHHNEHALADVIGWLEREAAEAKS
ncbi:Cof-type HAD-IIB family hydrolase [Paenibacillus rigui]|uniref:Hydrolase n=1 Tax=Paenibacillus rigui TaxID=554312 RepID=A0A229URI8_9BACL|nr:Cof-type HAD-IIB family hydrolase [Paenibacillus rigui]OXM85933.1 hydrolase [Paenibacillus rigui]